MSLTTEFFNFGRKKSENLSFKNGHFSTNSCHFFANYINIFHKNEVQTVILRCLVCLNLDLVKSYDVFLVIMFIFLCLKMHHFRSRITKQVLIAQKKTICHVLKMGIFKKFFGDVMSHLIRLNAGEKMKMISELFISKKLIQVCIFFN